MAGSDCEGHRRRRFQPFKKLQKLFRRKGKAGEDDDPSEASALPEAPPSPQAQRRRASGKSASSPNKYRLSMSHDSIFQTGGDSTAGMDSAASIPSLPSSSSRLAAELRSVLTKKRGDGDDDDSGLPRSPASPPDGPLHTGKTQTGKSGGSCSDGSMLSIYSSGTGTGTDDDIFGPLSENSSRLSLSRDQDSLELRPAGALSHAAAKHRIAVRPRRNHGGSRPRRPGRTGPTPASVPATVEEEGSEHPPTAAEKTETSDQGLPAEGPARGRATLPATGVAVAERATPVQRSRSTIADRRLRDLSPRKLWGRDSSEPAPASEKKSEGFFSRLFGSRRSGRKRKTGSKDAEDTPRAPSRRDASQEDREEARDEADAPSSRAPESLPARPLAAAEGGEASAPAEVVSEPDVVDSAHSALEKERKESAAALAREMRAVGLLAAKKQSLERSEEDAVAQSAPREEESRQEERAQRSPEVTARPRSILRSGSRSISQGSEGAEVSKPTPQTPPESEPQSLESISDHEAPAAAAAAEHMQPEEQEWKEKEPDDQKSQEEEEESPPVLRRRRATPERSEEQHLSQTSRSSGSQKLSWMEELRRSPPRDASTGHDPRRTYVKEAARTSSSGDEDTQRTPSWVKEEPRKSPQSSQHELRKTWIKETPKTPPSSEEGKQTPPWVKDEMRKSSPPPATEEEPAGTPPWVTEELERASMPPGDPTSGVPLRPARARPGRRPVSSADPILPVPSPAASTGATSGYRAPGPSPPTGVDKRRRASALVFGGAEPASPLDSGPRSLDSAVLLSADPVEPAIRRRPAPAADPAVSTADGSRLATGAEEAAAGSSTGSSDRLSSASSEADGKRASSATSEGRQSEEDRQSAQSVSRSGSSESVCEIAGEAGEALAEISDREENSGRPGSATSGTASDQTGSRKSLAESVGSSPSDSGQCDELNTPEEESTLPVSSTTPDRPEVPAKPRKVSETEPTATPPSTPTQEGSRLSPVERTPSSEVADVTPEFMKIHLHHRAETPSGMTTQVVVPKPKTRETPSKPTTQSEARESKVEAKPEVESKKIDKVETKPDHKFDGLTNDIPEVVLIEKHHSPRQSRSSVQSFHEDHPTVDVKPTPTPTAAPIAAPKSPKPAPEVPARPSVLSSVKTPDFSARTPDSSRHSSLGRQSTQDSDESEPVVLRRRPPPPAAAAAASTSPDSELLKVFKRRSLKTVSSEESAPKLSTPTTPTAISTATTVTEDTPTRSSQEEVPRARTSVVTAPAPASPPESRPSWSQRSISMPAGGPKSPPVRETGPPSIGAVPTVDMAPARPERPRKPVPPPTQPRPAPPVAAAVSASSAPTAEVATTPVTADPPRVKSTTPDAARALSAASAAAGPSGEQRRSAQGAEEEAAPTADWLKLVRERREQREQREQQTMRKLGHKELIIEPDTLAPARTPAPRSSRVLEMASTFQKLQPT